MFMLSLNGLLGGYATALKAQCSIPCSVDVVITNAGLTKCKYFPQFTNFPGDPLTHYFLVETQLTTLHESWTQSGIHEDSGDECLHVTEPRDSAYSFTLDTSYKLTSMITDTINCLTTNIAEGSYNYYSTGYDRSEIENNCLGDGCSDVGSNYVNSDTITETWNNSFYTYNDSGSSTRYALSYGCSSSGLTNDVELGSSTSSSYTNSSIPEYQSYGSTNTALSPTSETYVAGTQFFLPYTADGQTVNTLGPEYTDPILFGNLMAMLSVVPTNWGPGVASVSAGLSDQHDMGSLSRAKFRFRIKAPTDFLTTYTITYRYKYIMHLNGQADSTTTNSDALTEQLRGSGSPVDDVIGTEHDLALDSFYAGATNGGTKEKLVEILDVSFSSPASASAPGSGPSVSSAVSGPSFSVSASGGGGGSGCSSCGGGSSSKSTSVVGSGQFSASFSMGNESFGQPAGILAAQSVGASTNLATPAALQFYGDVSNIVTLFGSNGYLRQVLAPQTLADVVTIDPYTYEIRYYYSNQVGALSGGFYTTTGSPYVTWQFKNPNTNTCDTLQLTETRGAASWVYSYQCSTNTGAWTYIAPGSVSQETSTIVNGTDNTYTITNLISETNGQPALIVTRTYQTFSWGTDPGQSFVGLISQIYGTGPAARTTTTSYYTNGEYGSITGSALPVKEVVNPDGTWQYYTYTTINDVLVPSAVYSAFGDSQANGSYDGSTGEYNCTSYDYSSLDVSDDGSQQPLQPRTVYQYENGELVSITYSVFTPGERQDFRCTTPYPTLNDPDNLETDTKYYTSGTNCNRVQSIAYPNGTMSIYSYVQGTNGWQTNTVATGQPDGTGSSVINGSATTTVLDSFGATVSVATKDVASGLLTLDDEYGNFDSFDRAQVVTHLGGTSNQFDYACCYLESTVDADGVATYFLHDAAKRQNGYEKFYGITNPITYENVLDAAGRSIASLRIGTDGSIMTLGQAEYNDAGRLIVQTNALGGMTSYCETNDPASGGLQRLTFYPNGSSKVESYYDDGMVKSITGTAVHGRAYGHGPGYDVNGNTCTFSVQTNLDYTGDPTAEWVQTFNDMVGRPTETLYADGTYSQKFYDSHGNLTNSVDPDGVGTIYAYNPRGELAYTVADMNRNGQIDWGGPDRITGITNFVMADHGTSVRCANATIWLDGQTAFGTLISSNEDSVDGLQSWHSKFRDGATPVTASSQTVPGTSRTTTIVNPDNSYTVNSYSYGLPISSTKYDATSAQIGAITYGYDAHYRQNATTDARNGTTTFGFNAADQITTNTTPNPGTGGSSEITVTAYDNMLRPDSVMQPDGTVVNSSYLLTGELGLQYGSRTYPVGYSYDYAGRMRTMTNWNDFSGGAGSRVTAWNYDGQRGWLTNKAYADGNGPGYSYTHAGRLAGRAWVRNVTTAYSYNPAGELTNVVYSDSTPQVGYAYDRLGRQIGVLRDGMIDYKTYDLANNLLSESFSNGILSGLSVKNQYDTFLRRTNLSTLNGSTVLTTTAYGYDAASRLKTVSDGTNSATYSYLANSPLVSQIVFKNGSATRMTTTKQYDYLNRLTQISSIPSAAYTQPLTFNYNYNSANQRTKNTLADGSYWVYGYDALGQVTNGCKFFSDGTPVAGQQFDYSFDTIGNRTQTKAGGDTNGLNLRVANYTNNILNQITSRDVPGYVDIMGASILTNTVTVNGQTAYRKQEYFRQQLAVNNSSMALWTNITVSGGQSVSGNIYLPPQLETFKYDADGNLTNDGRWIYIWDGENQLIQMTVNTNVGPQYTLKFAYDFQGRRIQKMVFTNGVGVYTNNFVYDGWNLTAILNPQSSILQSFMWGSDLSGSLQGAGGVGGLLSASYNGSATTNCFPAFDGNGNVVALVIAVDGTLTANYDYGPFGEVIRATGPMAKANPMRFSTKYQDDESDLLYYGYRYYKPSTGTWLSRDPLGDLAFFKNYTKTRSDSEVHDLSTEALMSPCLFVHNDPIDENDMFGLKDINVPSGCSIIGIGLAGGIIEIAVILKGCSLIGPGEDAYGKTPASMLAYLSAIALSTAQLHCSCGGTFEFRTKIHKDADGTCHYDGIYIICNCPKNST